ncbi:PREDICTED: nicotinamide riboside kinase 1 [Nicrophorus vespilloides]|uniref:Nicotinamide riboside kinase 1 n=1 Tax=Nicrophorus vespilloides TaxID=110193 RepID=A0ABM1N5I5_NICVS|nr:PREDICTED: nicotinamide riboside kinase 1 [Nicrophorus vespilloides]
MPAKKLLVVGISGVTCGGKSTLARNLQEKYPDATVISQDDYFLDVMDPRHTWIEELDHINFDILSSLDMERMLSDAKELMELTTGILIIEGFSIFNCRHIEELCNLKYFFKLKKEVCRERRSRREYDPPDCPGYFDRCVWPEHIEQLKEVERTVEGVTYFENVESDHALEAVLKDVRRESE